MSYSPFRRERGRSRTCRQKCWKLPGNTSSGFNIGYLQLACQSHVTSNICKDINVAHHRYSNIYIHQQHKEENCKSLEHGAFRARMELLVKIFLAYTQHIPTLDVQLCQVAFCVVYTLCNWNGSSSHWSLFCSCSGDYISEGVQIPAACFLGEKGFLWYAPDQQWDARVAEPHADPRAEKTELAGRRRISPIQSKHYPGSNVTILHLWVSSWIPISI